MRATVRPLPSGGIWKGLRLTAFYDGDGYGKNAARRRAVAEVTFESTPVNAGFDLLDAKDRPSARNQEVEGRGWSAWVAPKIADGWELLLRHDHTQANRDLSQTREREIAGIAYWIPNLQKVTAAVMLDYDTLHVTNRANDTRYGLKLLVNF